MKKLSDRIRFIRKKLGISQQELANILGCTDGKIKGWEQDNTKNIKLRDSFLLAQRYGFSQGWIEDGKGEPIPNKGELLLNNIANTSAMLSQTVSIPYFKDINASAGYGCTNGDCKPVYINMSPDMLPTSSKNVEAIRVMGNSMSGTIEDEDVIFIDKNDIQAVDGKIYVLFLCDEVYVKRIFIEPRDKSIILKSDNSIFPQLKADCEDFRIIGRVVANMHISKL